MTAERTLAGWFALAASTALGAASPDTSQRTSAPGMVLTSSGKWVVEYADWQCVLNRELSMPGGRSYFSASVEPVNPLVWLRLATPTGDVERDSGEAVVRIDGRPIDGTVAYRISKSENYQIREFVLDERKHQLASVKDKVRLSTTRHGDIEVVLDGFQPAWAAVRRCMSDLYSGLGIDEAIVSQVAVPPQGRSLSFVERPVVPRGKSLQFAALYWVDPNGRVEDCRMLKTSGHWKFDHTFCKQLQRWGRFTPARDFSGQPVRAPRLDNQILRRPMTLSGAPVQIRVRQ